jgi:hypothetical protein
VTRETIEVKARRYLGEGRLAVTHVLGDHVAAVCQGETGTYELGYTPARGWWCDCAARRECAHLVALQLVTVRRRTPFTGSADTRGQQNVAA